MPAGLPPMAKKPTMSVDGGTPVEYAGAKRKPVVVLPEHGRFYEMGRMRTVFKADGEETSERFSISD